MGNTTLSKATLGRLPLYLQYVRTVESEMISATTIARNLGLGEVQVRKDLSMISREGQPKVGYPTEKLRRDLEKALEIDRKISTVIVGAGQMGTALMEDDSFQEYGLEIVAAFDNHPADTPGGHGALRIYGMSDLKPFCQQHAIQLGILTVPTPAAQDAADLMVESGISAILNFTPRHIRVPAHVTVQQLNAALALVHLNTMVHQGRSSPAETQYGRQIM